MPKKLTMEEKREQIKEVHGDKISLLNDKNVKEKSLFRCNFCNSTYEQTFYDTIHRKYWCPQCSGRRHFRDAKEVSAILFDLYGDKIYMDEDTFVNTITPPTIHCRDCGYTWTPNLMDLFRGEGCGCPACQHKAPVSKEEAHKRVLEESDGNIDFYDETFVNVSTKALMFCKICGYAWWTRPSDIYNKHQGCGRCVGIAKYTYEEILDIVFKGHDGKIKVLTPKHEYKNTAQKLNVYCTECGYEWKSSVHELKKYGCPMCLKNSMEKPTLEAFRKKGIEPLHDIALEGSNYKGSTMPLRADFIIETPKGKLAIEADGRQHFEPIHGKARLIYQQEKDRHKDKYLKARGYVFIRITSSPTKEWGFPNHVVMNEFFELLDESTDGFGNIDIDVFRPYDFNRE